MRLVAAELLKIRHRTASYVVLLLLIGLMALVYLLIGLSGSTSRSLGGDPLRFPGAYGVIDQFVFGLGSLFAVAYAAAIGGADWNWGMVRVFVARGESRGRYVIAKLVGLAIALFLGVLIALVAGIVLTLLAGLISGSSTGDPFSGGSLGDLLRSIALGFPVLMERVAIGFAVAMILRSQLAGVIAGIALYIGEGILRTILIALTLGSRLGGGGGVGGAFAPTGPEWYQFLPFSIGDSVLAAGPRIAGSDVGSLLLRPVELPLAMAVVLGYLVLAAAIAAISVERAQIAG